MPRQLRQRPARTWIAGLAACAASLAIALSAEGDAGVWAACALVLVVCAPLAARLRRDPLDAPGIYALLSGLCYGLMSLSWLGDLPPVPAPGIGQDDVRDALVLVACGLAAFGVAARFAAGPVRPRPPL